MAGNQDHSQGFCRLTIRDYLNEQDINRLRDFFGLRKGNTDDNKKLEDIAFDMCNLNWQQFKEIHKDNFPKDMKKVDDLKIFQTQCQNALREQRPSQPLQAQQRQELELFAVFFQREQNQAKKAINIKINNEEEQQIGYVSDQINIATCKIQIDNNLERQEIQFYCQDQSEQIAYKISIDQRTIQTLKNYVFVLPRTESNSLNQAYFNSFTDFKVGWQLILRQLVDRVLKHDDTSAFQLLNKFRAQCTAAEINVKRLTDNFDFLTTVSTIIMEYISNFKNQENTQLPVNYAIMFNYLEKTRIENGEYVIEALERQNIYQESSKLCQYLDQYPQELFDARQSIRRGIIKLFKSMNSSYQKVLVYKILNEGNLFKLMEFPERNSDQNYSSFWSDRRLLEQIKVKQIYKIMSKNERQIFYTNITNTQYLNMRLENDLYRKVEYYKILIELFFSIGELNHQDLRILDDIVRIVLQLFNTSYNHLQANQLKIIMETLSYIATISHNQEIVNQVNTAFGQIVRNNVKNAIGHRIKFWGLKAWEKQVQENTLFSTQYPFWEYLQQNQILISANVVYSIQQCSEMQNLHTDLKDEKNILRLLKGQPQIQNMQQTFIKVIEDQFTNQQEKNLNILISILVYCIRQCDTKQGIECYRIDQCKNRAMEFFLENIDKLNINLFFSHFDEALESISSLEKENFEQKSLLEIKRCLKEYVYKMFQKIDKQIVLQILKEKFLENKNINILKSSSQLYLTIFNEICSAMHENQTIKQEINDIRILLRDSFYYTILTVKYDNNNGPIIENAIVKACATTIQSFNKSISEKTATLNLVEDILEDQAQQYQKAQVEEVFSMYSEDVNLAQNIVNIIQDFANFKQNLNKARQFLRYIQIGDVEEVHGQQQNNLSQQPQQQNRQAAIAQNISNPTNLIMSEKEDLQQFITNYSQYHTKKLSDIYQKTYLQSQTKDVIELYDIMRQSMLFIQIEQLCSASNLQNNAIQESRRLMIYKQIIGHYYRIAKQFLIYKQPNLQQILEQSEITGSQQQNQAAQTQSFLKHLFIYNKQQQQQIPNNSLEQVAEGNNLNIQMIKYFFSNIDKTIQQQKSSNLKGAIKEELDIMSLFIGYLTKIRQIQYHLELVNDIYNCFQIDQLKQYFDIVKKIVEIISIQNLHPQQSNALKLLEELQKQFERIDGQMPLQDVARTMEQYQTADIQLLIPQKSLIKFEEFFKQLSKFKDAYKILAEYQDLKQFILQKDERNYDAINALKDLIFIEGVMIETKNIICDKMKMLKERFDILNVYLNQVQDLQKIIVQVANVNGNIHKIQMFVENAFQTMHNNKQDIKDCIRSGELKIQSVQNKNQQQYREQQLEISIQLPKKKFFDESYILKLEGRIQIYVDWQKHNQRQFVQEQIQQQQQNQDDVLDIEEIKRFQEALQHAKQFKYIIQNLQDIGHFEYQNVSREYTYPNFVNEKNKLYNEIQALKEILEKWKNEIKRLCQQYFLLYFISAQNILKIKNVLSNYATVTEYGSLHSLIDILKFIYPQIEDQLAINFFKGLQIKMHAKDIKENFVFIELFARETHQLFQPLFRNNAPKRYQVQQQIKLILVKDTFEAICYCISLQAQNNTVYAPYQFLFCDKNTSEKELNIFIQSFLNASLTGDSAIPFFVFNIHNTQFNVRQSLKRIVYNLIKKNEQTNNQLFIIINNNFRQGDPTLNYSSNMVEQYFDPQGTEPQKIIAKAEDYLTSARKNIKIFTSQQPGLGKSFQIQNKQGIKPQNIMRIPFFGDLSKGALAAKFKSSYSSQQQQQYRQQQTNGDEYALHLDIYNYTTEYDLNQLLFEILYIGCINFAQKEIISIYNTRMQTVFIEIGNSFNEELLRSLQIVNLLGKGRIHIGNESFLENLQIPLLQPTKNDTYLAQTLYKHNEKHAFIVLLKHLQGLTLNDSYLFGTELDESEKAYYNKAQKMEKRLAIISKNEAKGYINTFFVQKLQQQNVAPNFYQLFNFAKQIHELVRNLGKMACCFSFYYLAQSQNVDANRLRLEYVRPLVEVCLKSCISSSNSRINNQLPTLRRTDQALANAIQLNQRSKDIPSFNHLLQQNQLDFFMINNALKLCIFYANVKNVPKIIIDLFNKVQKQEIPTLATTNTYYFLRELVYMIGDEPYVTLPNFNAQDIDNGVRNIELEEEYQKDHIRYQKEFAEYRQNISETKHKLTEICITRDNYYKMALIYLCIASGRPVILMGETGIGKTALINLMANIMEAEYDILNIHAGITERDIEEFITPWLDKMYKTNRKILLFFDEANTNPNIQGILKDIIVDQSFKGRRFDGLIVPVAACNPYILKPDAEAANSAGLKAEEYFKNIAGVRLSTVDTSFHLVYSVHPIPESFMNFLWNFDRLQEADEKDYIIKILQQGNNNFALAKRKELQTNQKYASLKALINYFDKQQQFKLFSSEQMIGLQAILAHVHARCREYEYLQSVSLRDISRFSRLLSWIFENILQKLEFIKQNINQPQQQHNQLYNTQFCGGNECTPGNAPQFLQTIKMRALVLALNCCYLSKIKSRDRRISLANEIVQLFAPIAQQQLAQPNIFTYRDWEEHVKNEQMDFALRLKKEDGIALNSALIENLYLNFICIMTKTPLFITGKPGTSKTLSANMIVANLRGAKAHDAYIQTLQSVYPIYYQGHLKSTSEAIKETFDQARKCQKEDSAETRLNEIVVMIFDEIGLAEASESNPLKILHSELEPPPVSLMRKYKRVPPEPIAFIGISNWSLDASKMNRGITLNRIDFNDQDLEETAQHIRESIVPSDNAPDQYFRDIIKFYKAHIGLLQKYHEFKDYHGYRDFYAMIKLISRSLRNKTQVQDCESIVLRAVLRNLSGIYREEILPEFKENIRQQLGLNHAHIENQLGNPIDLIKENIEQTDLLTRHVMIITQNVEAAKIEALQLLGDKPYKVFFGSDFKDDLSADNTFNITNQILYCVENGICVILINLNVIYQNFYDLLNQKYSRIGENYFCRVAYNAQFNVVKVHRDLKIILIQSQDTIKYLDPPLLSRFEKHTYTATCRGEFAEVEQLILNFIQRANQNETKPVLSSLNAFQTMQLINSCRGSNRENLDFNQLYSTCIQQIIGLCTYRQINKLLASQQLDDDEKSNIAQLYFYKTKHNTFEDFFLHLLTCNRQSLKRQGTSGLSVIINCPNSHEIVQLPNILCRGQYVCMIDNNHIYVNNLRRMQDLEETIQQFFMQPLKEGETDAVLFIVADQLKTQKFERFVLTKQVLENARKTYEQQLTAALGRQQKHIVYIFQQDASEFLFPVGFDPYWICVTLDNLVNQAEHSGLDINGFFKFIENKEQKIIVPQNFNSQNITNIILNQEIQHLILRNIKLLYESIPKLMRLQDENRNKISVKYYTSRRQLLTKLFLEEGNSTLQPLREFIYRCIKKLLEESKEELEKFIVKQVSHDPLNLTLHEAILDQIRYQLKEKLSLTLQSIESENTLDAFLKADTQQARDLWLTLAEKFIYVKLYKQDRIQEIGLPLEFSIPFFKSINEIIQQQICEIPETFADTEALQIEERIDHLINLIFQNLGLDRQTYESQPNFMQRCLKDYQTAQTTVTNKEYAKELIEAILQQQANQNMNGMHKIYSFYRKYSDTIKVVSNLAQKMSLFVSEDEFTMATARAASEIFQNKSVANVSPTQIWLCVMVQVYVPKLLLTRQTVMRLQDSKGKWEIIAQQFCNYYKQYELQAKTENQKLINIFQDHNYAVKRFQQYVNLVVNFFLQQQQQGGITKAAEQLEEKQKQFQDWVLNPNSELDILNIFLHYAGAQQQQQQQQEQIFQVLNSDQFTLLCAILCTRLGEQCSPQNIQTNMPIIKMLFEKFLSLYKNEIQPIKNVQQGELIERAWYLQFYKFIDIIFYERYIKELQSKYFDSLQEVQKPQQLENFERIFNLLLEDYSSNYDNLLYCCVQQHICQTIYNEFNLAYVYTKDQFWDRLLNIIAEAMAAYIKNKILQNQFKFQDPEYYFLQRFQRMSRVNDQNFYIYQIYILREIFYTDDGEKILDALVQAIQEKRLNDILEWVLFLIGDTAKEELRVQQHPWFAQKSLKNLIEQQYDKLIQLKQNRLSQEKYQQTQQGNSAQQTFASLLALTSFCTSTARIEERERERQIQNDMMVFWSKFQYPVQIQARIAQCTINQFQQYGADMQEILRPCQVRFLLMFGCALASMRRNNFFLEFVKDPVRFAYKNKGLYIPFILTDSSILVIAEALMADKETNQMTRYRCRNCKTIFLVGDCGATWDNYKGGKGVCLTCGVALGALSGHDKPTQYSERIDKDPITVSKAQRQLGTYELNGPGSEYIHFSYNQNNIELDNIIQNLSVRNLSFVQFRLGSLIIYSLYFIAAAANQYDNKRIWSIIKGKEQTVEEPIDGIKNYLLRAIKEQWCILSKIVGIENQDDLLYILMEVVNKLLQIFGDNQVKPVTDQIELKDPQTLRNYESQIMQLLTKGTFLPKEETTKIITSYLNHKVEQNEGKKNIVLAKEGYTNEQISDALFQASMLPNLFRKQRFIDQSIPENLINNASADIKYSVINQIMRIQKTQLYEDYVQSMKVFISVYKIIRQKFDRKYFQNEIVVYDDLGNFVINSSKLPHREIQQGLFDRFIQNWNTIAQNAKTKYECQDKIKISQLDPRGEFPIITLFYNEKLSGEFYQLINFLCTFQNRELNKIFELGLQSSEGRSQFVDHFFGDPESQKKKISLHLINENINILQPVSICRKASAINNRQQNLNSSQVQNNAQQQQPQQLQTAFNLTPASTIDVYRYITPVLHYSRSNIYITDMSSLQTEVEKMFFDSKVEIDIQNTPIVSCKEYFSNQLQNIEYMPREMKKQFNNDDRQEIDSYINNVKSIKPSVLVELYIDINLTINYIKNQQHILDFDLYNYLKTNDRIRIFNGQRELEDAYTKLLKKAKLNNIVETAILIENAIMDLQVEFCSDKYTILIQNLQTDNYIPNFIASFENKFQNLHILQIAVGRLIIRYLSEKDQTSPSGDQDMFNVYLNQDFCKDLWTFDDDEQYKQYIQLNNPFKLEIKFSQQFYKLICDQIDRNKQANSLQTAQSQQQQQQQQQYQQQQDTNQALAAQMVDFIDQNQQASKLWKYEQSHDDNEDDYRRDID